MASRGPRTGPRQIEPDDEPITGARQIGDEFAGQDTELTEEQVAEATGQDAPDEGPGLLGRIGRDDVKEGTPGDDLVGDGDPNAPPADPRERLGQGNPFVDAATAPGVESTDVTEAGVFDLIDQPGAADSDPLSSFLGAVEGKVGRDSGLTAPGDQTNASPAHGQHSVADRQFGPKTLEQHEYDAHFGLDGETFIGPQTLSDTVMDIEFGQDRYNPRPDPEPEEAPADDPSDGEVTGGHDDPDGPPPDPGSDDEVAPLPADLQAQLASDVGRFRRLRPDSGDGTTDPSEIDGEAVGPAGDVPDHADVGQGLFGQPDTDAPTGGDSNANPGASSHGTGVITPEDGQAVAAGPQRNDDPFDAAEPAAEPPVGSDDGGDDPLFDSVLPSDAGLEVEATDEVSDVAFDPPD